MPHFQKSPDSWGRVAFGARALVGWWLVPICGGASRAWYEPSETEANIGWARALAEQLRPQFSGIYVNYLGAEDEEQVRAAYGASYERLAALKAQYDPTNFFSQNQNIRPRS